MKEHAITLVDFTTENFYSVRVPVYKTIQALGTDWIVHHPYHHITGNGKGWVVSDPITGFRASCGVFNTASQAIEGFMARIQCTSQQTAFDWMGKQIDTIALF